MRNKYLFAGLCLLVIVLCLVSACGGGGSTTSSAATGTTTTLSTSTSSTQSTTSSTVGGSVSDILGKGLNVDTVSYTLTMTTTGQPTVTMTVYKKFNKMREEMMVTGYNAAVIINGDTHKMYTLMLDLKMATEMPYDSSAMVEGSWENASDVLQYAPMITGTETIDGKSCTIIAWEDPNGSAKEWVWTETGIPLKMQITSGGVTNTIEYSNFSFSDIADSMFEVPADFQLVTQPAGG
jgi:hypothetical protein